MSLNFKLIPGTLTRCPMLNGRLQYLCTNQCQNNDTCSQGQMCCQHDCGTVCVIDVTMPDGKGVSTRVMRMWRRQIHGRYCFLWGIPIGPAS